MRTIIALLAIVAVLGLMPGKASAIGMALANCDFDDCYVRSGPRRLTQCEDMSQGGGSINGSWLQRANIEERIEKIRASIASLAGGFKPAPEID